MRDFQRGKVYKWEQQFVAPHCNRVIPFNDAQMFVNGIWMALGLIGPPDVDLMPKNATAAFAVGCRQYIKIREQTPAWIIIHELAHTLTMTHEGLEDAAHGPDFVGVYIKLLDKVLGIPATLLMYTLAKSKIEYNLAAQPVFVKEGLKVL